MLGTILHWVLNSKQPAKIPKSMTTHHPTPDRPLAVGSSTDTTEDRFIRNDRHFLIAKRYIEENPVVAGLATSPEAWSWGSAHFEPSLPDF